MLCEYLCSMLCILGTLDELFNCVSWMLLGYVTYTEYVLFTKYLFDAPAEIILQT